MALTMPGNDTMPQALQDFAKEAETEFHRVEGLLSNSTLDLEAARNVVLILRRLAQEHRGRGCDDLQMEKWIMQRTGRILEALVTGAEPGQSEVYEPRQTMVFVFCTLAVFPASVQLVKQDQSLVYNFSTDKCRDCYDYLADLTVYGFIKTLSEGPLRPQNLLTHLQLLLKVAMWLETDRAVVAFLVVTEGFLHARIIAIVAGNRNGQLVNPRAATEVRRLYKASLIIYASCLIRLGFMDKAKELFASLRRVDQLYLPAALTAKLAYVQAVLFKENRDFAKSMEKARRAQLLSQGEDLKTEIENLIDELKDSLQKEQRTHPKKNAPDEDWLAGTNARLPQANIKKQEEARRKHQQNQQYKRKRRRRTSLDSTYSSISSMSSRSSSISDVSVEGYASPSPVVTSFKKNLKCYSDDDSGQEEDEDEVEREIHFVVDDDDNHYAYGVGDTEPLCVDGAFGVEPVAVEKTDWFEKSEEAIASMEADEEEREVKLSDAQADRFEKGGEGRSFYFDFIKEAEQRWKSNPDKYKRCQLKIERAHRSIAKVLDKGSKYTDILIEGRSKAGRTYMDDEVVVEILAEPGQNRGLQQTKGTSFTGNHKAVEKLAHGKVVGLLKRVNFASVEHPVLFCTLDEMEGHLMLPLCKTVPKIHVMNDTVKGKYPALEKHRIEVKRITADGNVEHRRFCDVQPDKREQYVFKVVILAWRQRNIYPLGAVLDFYISGRDYSGGLRVLSMQQRVPKLYPHDAVEHTKTLLQQTLLPKTGREDLTGERLFTIDPPGSKDLDDAVSIKKEGPHYVIGVHIADVAAVVKKGSGVDLEARRRAVTFYPLDRKPHPMLPEPLSHGKCSLLPGEERLALSVFFTFDENGRQVEEPVVKKTVIKSCAQLTYEEVQKVINEDARVDVESAVQADIRQLHKITSKLQESRQKLSMFFVPFEDPRLPDLEKMTDHMDAHSLIEELMILTNCYIATRLTRRPRLHDVMVLRCHKAPTYEELAEWRDKEGSVSNLVMQLQGKKVSPDTRLSLDTCTTRGGPSRQQNVVVQSEVWMKLCRHLEQGEMTEARRLAFMDAVHPLQCLAASHWMDLMETAHYKCSYGLNTPDRRHFGLDVDVYTHSTSPIRRYADLHVQRLLHADLDGKRPDCTPDDVTELCQHINGATSRQRAFGKGCMALKVAESLQRQPLVFRAFVESVDTEQLTLCLPSLLKVSDRKQELPFSMLGVSCQPELVTDTMLRQDSVTVQWNRRIYDEKGTRTGKQIPVWKFLEKSGNRSSSSPVVMTLRPDQLSVSVRQQDWAEILKALVSNSQQAWDKIPQPVSRVQSEVDYMSSEKGDGTVSLRPVQFRRVYTAGQVVQVQMSAEPKKGMLKPRVEILHTARNASVCTPHVTDPVLALTRFAKQATRDQNFSNYQDYVRAWMPLMEMEAAVGAGDSKDGVVIENINVIIKTQGPPSNILYRGTFSLEGKFCYDRCIDFGGKSADSIRQEESKSDNSFPLDYLCLRYKMDCSDSVVSRVKQSEVSETVDRQFTWLAHASVVQVIHKDRKAEDGGRMVVTFVLSPSSPQPPPQLMTKEGARLTLEVLPKSDVDRRVQEMLLALNDEKCELAQAIAFSTKIPELDSAHRKLGQRDANHEVPIPNPKKLPRNNPPQKEAIKLAMTHSLSIIQGPPGSGKTNTGIKLVYLFCKINRQLEAEGKGKKTVLYCGPSNKSVDLVARELKYKLGASCPKMVRMYGSTIEAKDYPVPRGDLRSTRGMRDLICDPRLRDVALHHLIRQDGKPHAEEISVFEKYFDKCRQEPDKYSVSNKQLKMYRKLLFEASVEELKHYEVVLATCAVGGTEKLLEGTENTIFQLIIDECAMSPEPQSMVPIIATRAQQVVLIGDHKQLRPIIKCQPAAELGLDQSLFERLFLKFPAYTTFLNKQYRMHQEICAFPSEEFYDNKLTTHIHPLGGGELLPFWPKHPLIPDRPVPHLLVDVRGEEETLTVTTDQGNERSKSNRPEADKVIDILTYLKREFNVDLLKVSLLTQYNAQRHLLEEKVKMAVVQNRDIFEPFDKFKVNISTVVSSQGGEWDYVIMSTVRSLPSYKIEPNPTHGWCRHNLGFITDRNQVNVALTRARKGLFIVGNVELLRCDEVWRHLVERYERLGCCIRDASVFPPPPAPIARHRQRHVQRNASDHWQKVTEKILGHIYSNVMDRPSPSQYWAQQQEQLQQRVDDTQGSPARSLPPPPRKKTSKNKPSRGPSSYKVKALDTRVYPTLGEDTLKTVASSPTIQDKPDSITTAAVKNEGEYTVMDNGDDGSYEMTRTGTMEAEIKPKQVVAAAERPTVQTQGLGDAPLTSPVVSPSSGPQRTHPVVQPGENGPESVISQPVFCETWQFCGRFSSSGGQLRGRDSDVILVIPENAINDINDKAPSSADPSSPVLACEVTVPVKPDASKTPDITADVSNRSTSSGLSEETASNGVEIYGTISTDLTAVHTKLSLASTETISSPVVEYYAGVDCTFQKPVCISLPHFLPPGVSANDHVRVYQFDRDAVGEIRLEMLTLVTVKDNTPREGCDESSGDIADDVRRTGVFYFNEKREIKILVHHFSGYFCTHCKKEVEPPHLRLRLYGTHTQRRTRDVNLKLFIWDLRLNIRDFRKVGLPSQEEDQKTFITSQTLEPISVDDIGRVKLGVCIHLPDEEDISEGNEIWMHKQRSNGRLILPPRRKIGLQRFVPCCLDTEPGRVEWTLQTRCHPQQPLWFDCYIDAGYVDADDKTFSFRESPEMQTLQVIGLKLMNEQESKETQTDLDTADTHVKRVTDGLRSEGGFCPDNINCSTDRSRNCQPSPELLSPNANNTRDVLALNNGQLGSSGYQALSINFTFNNNSKTEIHNNVEKLNKMNIGNSHSTCNNMEAPARPEVSPPPEMPMDELPEEEMRQQSLRLLQDS